MNLNQLQTSTIMIIAFTRPEDMYSRAWIKYCEEKGISYKIIDIYSTDAISQIKGCDVFMWHHNQVNPMDLLFAKQILAAVEASGMIVWPESASGWHFDDKVAESYLFDALNLPMVPYYIFYDKHKALDWAKTASFPKVFKLRGGAGSMNVMLAHNVSEAQKFIRQAFGKGFSQFNWKYSIVSRYHKWLSGHDSLMGVIKGVVHALIGDTELAKLGRKYHKERGYAYFQDFLPNNDRDYRVIVINQNKAFAYYRMTRKNDFRASGSGDFAYDNIPDNVIKLAFTAAKTMGANSVAFDFLYTQQGEPKIVESSFCFGFDDTDAENGWWSDDMVFHQGKFNPFGWMVDGVIERYHAKK